MSKSYCVAGPIGAGKSTAIAQLNSIYGRDNVYINHEAVDLWRSLPDKLNNGHINLLDEMYKEPEKNFFPFQTYAFTTLAQRAEFYDRKRRLEGKILISERSLHCARYVFVETGLKAGYLDDIQYSVLASQYELLKEGNPLAHEFDTTFYLKTGVETMLERVERRARGEERAVDRAYMVAVWEEYEGFFSEINRDEKVYGNVIEIDANRTPNEVVEQMKIHMN